MDKLISAEKLSMALRDDPNIPGREFARVKRHIEEAEDETVHSHWEWFEEWNPSTPDHPRECEDCGWRCHECKTALADMVGGYWDNVFEVPKLNHCPNCGAIMDLPRITDQTMKALEAMDRKAHGGE